jgi:hypothetical protein
VHVWSNSLLSRRRKRKPRDNRLYIVDYYEPAFAEFHLDPRLEQLQRTPHEVRYEFWRIVPPGVYRGDTARELLDQYRQTVDRVLHDTIVEHSLSYFLHIYRRLFPGAIGRENSPHSVMLVRLTLEAAFQKYGGIPLCGCLGNSGEVGRAAILKGFFTSRPELSAILDRIVEATQLVLTNFGVDEFVAFYQTEKLAYEIWKTMAIRRACGKGAALAVTDDAELFHDMRDVDLNRLFESYDDRRSRLFASATGTVLDNSPGDVLMPAYNVDGTPIRDFAEIYNRWAGKRLLVNDRRIPEEMRPNFVWHPFSLRSYYNAHKPFAAAFEQVHQCTLRSVLLIIATALQTAVYLWRGDVALFIRHWQRAYDTVASLDVCADVLMDFLPMGLHTLGIEDPIDRAEIVGGLKYLTLSNERRTAIDVSLHGPLAMLLPCGTGGLHFFDYANIGSILYRMFHGLDVADQNFKGDALEVLVRRGGSILPTSACRATDGTQKQIDAAFSVGRTLVIAECKVRAHSLGFERGDPIAVQQRHDFVLEILRQADEKAVWLASRPLGRNYDIRAY